MSPHFFRWLYVCFLTPIPSALVNNLLFDNFPILAKLYSDTSDFWGGKTGGKSSAPFGLYFSMAINVDIGAKVSSSSHRDVKNLSVGLCCIVVFGGPTYCSLHSPLCLTCGWHQDSSPRTKRYGCNALRPRSLSKFQRGSPSCSPQPLSFIGTRPANVRR